MEKRAVRLTSVLEFAENKPLAVPGTEDILEALAVQDGATLVDVTSGRVRGRRQLVAEGMTDAERDLFMAELQANWSGWHKLLRWGTRHQSAVFFARAAKSVEGAVLAVVIVSRDGDIHVFDHHGLPIPECCYPPDSTEA